MHRKIFIFGFGYTARFLAKKLAELNFQIIGTSRTTQHLEFHHNTGYELIHFTKADVEKHLQSATHVLISTPPSADSGDPVLVQFHDLLQKQLHQTQWLGYLSSTGVYGDHQGNWVDELSASISPGQQGTLRLIAENAWLSLAMEFNLPLHIFRLAGIYGPQRNALARITHGKAQTIYKKNHFFSRIHVEDIATTLLASIQKPQPMSIYNVADDEPATSQDVDNYAASLLHIPPPQIVPFELADLSLKAKEFYTHNRRVSNAKIKQKLLVKLHYPDYKAGLKKLYDDKDY